MDGRQQAEAERLYRRYERSVFLTCLDLLGSREDAADATQEVFARALPVLPGVRHPSKWLHTAARHHCVDLLRRRRVAERLDTPAWVAGTEEPDPVDVVVRRDCLAATMAALPERERHALAHVALEDAPVRDVAVRMRLTYAAALQLVSRARRRAVQVGQLPSALGAPRLGHLAGLIRRITGPAAATPGIPRNAVAGTAMVLCTALLCTGGGSNGGHGTRGPSPHAAAPATAAPVLPGLVADAAPLDLSTHRIEVHVQPVRLPARPVARVHSEPMASATTVVWTGQPNSQYQTVGTDALGAQGTAAGGAGTPSRTPEDDLIEGTLGTTGCGGATVLVVRIHVQDLPLTLPQGMAKLQWAMSWDLPGWSTPVVSQQIAQSAGAILDSTGHFSYYDTNQNTTTVDGGRAVGGPGGYVEIDVPLAHLGIAPAAVLLSVAGTSSVAQSGGSVTWGVDSEPSSGSPVNYTIPSIC